MAAGRTDAGVHATGQVIHFQSGWTQTPADLERAMNAVLPESIAVAALERAKPEFHARYSAQSRRYRYDIWNGAHRSPLRHRFAWHRSKPLPTDALHAALQCLLGTHDFRAFAAGEEPDARTVRNVMSAQCRRRGNVVRITVEANAFLRHMVRRIVGTLVEIGEGRKPVEHMEEALHTGNKATAGPTAPAKGLFLVRVRYPDAFALEQSKEDCIA